MQQTERAGPDTLVHRMHDRRGRIGATLAASLLVLLAACNPTPSVAPSAIAVATPTPTAAAPTPTPIASPSATTVAPTPDVTAAPETGPAGAAACEPSDLKASHGFVDSAAGSRYTTVVLTAVIPCSVDLYPAFALRDANGTPLVGAAAAGPGRLDLDPELTYQSDVQLANWCADNPAFPLRFELRIAGAEVEVTGGSFPDAGDLPPCNGESQGPVLQGSSWEPVP
jgi:hypothetical protein